MITLFSWGFICFPFVRGWVVEKFPFFSPNSKTIMSLLTSGMWAHNIIFCLGSVDLADVVRKTPAPWSFPKNYNNFAQGNKREAILICCEKCQDEEIMSTFVDFTCRRGSGAEWRKKNKHEYGIEQNTNGTRSICRISVEL